MARQLNVSLPDHIVETLKERSAQSDIPQSRIVLRALERYFDFWAEPDLADPRKPNWIDKPGDAEKAPAPARRKAPPREPSELLYICPAPSCTFGAKSPAATCPHHGRKVV